MELTVRAFDHSDADYESWVQLTNLVWPEWAATVSSRRHANESTPPEAGRRWWMGQSEGRLVSIANFQRDVTNATPGSFILGLSVHPDVRRRGVGSRMYQHCLDQLDALHSDVLNISVFTKEDRDESVRFLERRGYECTLREPHSLIDLASYDAAKFQARVDQVLAQGFQIRTLAELQTEFPDWKLRYFRLTMDVLRDVPYPYPFQEPPFEDFSVRTYGDPHFNAHTRWVATRGGLWAGMTELWISPGEPFRGQTDLTGVRREARRQGVATALKVQALTSAKERGWKTVQTGNAESNPMYGINLAMGFKPLPAGLLFRLRRPTA